MLDGFQERFREEAFELLNSLEQSLLELEADPANREIVSAVFRSMHTIKGSAAMFGFEAISDFTHHVEEMFDDIRNDRLSVTRAVIDLTLESRDHIRHMLDEPDDTTIPAKSKELVGLIQREIDRSAGEEREAVDPSESMTIEAIGQEEPSEEIVIAPAEAQRIEDLETVPATWHVRFAPAADIASNGTNPLLLLAELRELGECTIVPNAVEIPTLDNATLSSAYVSWDIFLTTTHGEDAIRDIFIFVEGQCDLSLNLIDEMDSTDDEQYKRLGQILVERGVVDEELINRIVASQKRLGELLIGKGIDAHEVESALQEQEHIRQVRQKAQTEAAASSIRVHSGKLDDLVDLVGELVTLQARLTQTAGGLGGELSTISENFERLIGELRDHTMSIRMVPISTSFTRFRRLIRDLSRDLGKEVDLVTEGGETELDKTVIERLHDPLVHVIRNSIDHGLETPSERREAGKEPIGTVALKARHVGANVEVRVEDDGRGLDRERITRRAIDRGLIPKDTQLTESDVFDLIFAAGFSTADAVTTVSGRGVGMDVVRKEIEHIGGTVKLESRLGEGTSVVMSIPLTLAIIDGLLVRIGEERFVIPLSNVEECIEYYRDRERTGVVANRGDLLPIIELRREFGIDGEPPAIEQAVVVGTGIGVVGFIVDTVIGDHQTVIKNLG
ncbi:MAG: chemotaxis protein CheA, partial [Spirochaetales bacterium]|nr:chemotaxis protein CheA [Spirochaetales bacterium]